jgi:hypothetical protein
MHEMSLTDRTLAALRDAELPLDENQVSQRTRRRDAVGRTALVAADVVAVAVAWLIVLILPFSDLVWSPWVLAYPPFFMLLAKAAGLYDRDQFVLHKTTLDEGPALVSVAAIFALTIEGVQAFIYTGGSHPLPTWVILTTTLVVARAVARFAAVRTTEPERVLVIGDAATTALVRRKLSSNPALNATVVGRVGAGEERADRPDKLLGAVADLPAVIDRHRVERVVVAPIGEGGTDVVDIIRLATACGVRVAVLPRMLEVIGTSVVFDDLGGQLLLGVRGFGLSPSSRVLKRTFDVLVGSLVLIVLAPLLLAIALAIRLTSSGSVLFRQTRVEPRGPAPAHHGGGPAVLRLAAAPLPRRPGGDRSVADPGVEPRADERHGHHRLPLLRQLVPLAGRQDPRPHGALRAEQAQSRVPLELSG